MEPTTPNAQLSGGFRRAAPTLLLSLCSVVTPVTTEIVAIGIATLPFWDSLLMSSSRSD